MMPSVLRRATLLLLILSGPFVTAARAQFETAAVVGTVRDTSGATVPDAKITLTNTATGISQTKITSADGGFEFVTVRAGVYIVTAEKAGFTIALVDNVEVQVAARRRVDFTLPVGQITERVTVTAESPLLETDSSQRGQVITGDQMRELALNGREYSALVLVSIGVRESALNER